MARRLVSLTFDNGPFVGVTDRVLDELERRRILASFFVVGRSLARPGARALAERAIAAGHLVGNHSATHLVALGELSDPRAVDAEIDGCESMLDGLRGTPPLFRPFGNGGVLDHRLLSSHAVQRLTEVATARCCGTRCLTTGTIRPVGSTRPWRTWSPWSTP